MRLEKPFICPAKIGPEERDLADFSLSHGQEGSTTPSTKSVFVGMGNYFFLPQIRSVSVTRIPVNKYRLIPLFHCRVPCRASTTWRVTGAGTDTTIFSLSYLVRARQPLHKARMNHKHSSDGATRGVSHGGDTGHHQHRKVDLVLLSNEHVEDDAKLLPDYDKHNGFIVTTTDIGRKNK